MSGVLNRSITVWQAIALYVGAVIGSGILILPGMTAGIAGANALFSWGAMIVLSIPLAYTFAFLAREYPSAGGVSTFVERAFGRYAGALIGWFYFIAASAGQVIVPLTGGVYVSYVFHGSHVAAFVIAAMVLVGAITGNYFGLRISGKVQLATSGLVIVVLLGTILLAIPFMHVRALYPHVSSSMWGEGWPSIDADLLVILWMGGHRQFGAGVQSSGTRCNASHAGGTRDRGRVIFWRRSGGRGYAFICGGSPNDGAGHKRRFTGASHGQHRGQTGGRGDGRNRPGHLPRDDECVCRKHQPTGLLFVA